MSVPAIAGPTSILAPRRDQDFAYQPTATNSPYAWRASGLPPGMSIQSSFFFTTDFGSSTSQIVAPSNNFVVGSKAQMLNLGGALPTGLPSLTDVFIKTVSGDNITVSATLGGAALTFSDDGTGTQIIFNPATLGLISGAPTIAGFYEVRVIATNTDGDSTTFVFPIGVEEPGYEPDGSIEVDLDIVSGKVTRSGAGSDDTFVLYAKSTDKLVLAVALKKGDVTLDAAIANMVCAVKKGVDDPLVYLGNGSFLKVGSDQNTRYKIILDCTAIPTGGQDGAAAVDDTVNAKANTAEYHGLGEINVTFLYDPTGGTTFGLYPRASLNFDFFVQRSLRS